MGAATGAIRPWPDRVHGHAPAVQLLQVEGPGGGPGLGLDPHLHQPEAPRRAGPAVEFDRADFTVPYAANVSSSIVSVTPAARFPTNSLSPITLLAGREMSVPAGTPAGTPPLST